jgi:hypothetical protein
LRLQLRSASRRRLLAVTAAAGLLVAGAGGARANTEAASRVTLFREPSTGSTGVTVIHPQVDVAGALGSSVSITAGYEVDIVSGATPRTFGVDTVSGATKFSDVRQQVKGGIDYSRANNGLSAGYSYGWESDYKSSAVSATTRSDLLDHNFTLAVAYTHNFDDVCDANNETAAGQPLQLRALGGSDHCFKGGMADVVTHRLNIDTFEPSLTWTATPRLLVQGGTTVQILDGFQSNPYRSVLVGSQNRTPQEHMPLLRQRYAVFGRAAYALPDTRASLVGMVRFYRDSWALQAASTEIDLNKYLGQSVLITLRGRYHQQTGASFYRTSVGYRTLGPAGQYWTGDRELSPMHNYLAGGKVAVLRRPGQERSSWYSEIELSAKMEALFYRLDSPFAPNADRKMAYIWQGSFAIRF